MICVTPSFDISSPSKASQKPSMPLTVIGCLPEKDAFPPEGLITMWSDWVEFLDAELTLRVMLHTMAEFAMLVL